jgi:hypothetical protein
VQFSSAALGAGVTLNSADGSGVSMRSWTPDLDSKWHDAVRASSSCNSDLMAFDDAVLEDASDGGSVGSPQYPWRSDRDGGGGGVSAAVGSTVVTATPAAMGTAPTPTGVLQPAPSPVINIPPFLSSAAESLLGPEGVEAYCNTFPAAAVPPAQSPPAAASDRHSRGHGHAHGGGHGHGHGYSGTHAPPLHVHETLSLMSLASTNSTGSTGIHSDAFGTGSITSVSLPEAVDESRRSSVSATASQHDAEPLAASSGVLRVASYGVVGRSLPAGMSLALRHVLDTPPSKAEEAKAAERVRSIESADVRRHSKRMLVQGASYAVRWLSFMFCVDCLVPAVVRHPASVPVVVRVDRVAASCRRHLHEGGR